MKYIDPNKTLFVQERRMATNVNLTAAAKRFASEPLPPPPFVTELIVGVRAW